jgi:hypothetical protein
VPAQRDVVGEVQGAGLERLAADVRLPPREQLAPVADRGVAELLERPARGFGGGSGRARDALFHVSVIAAHLAGVVKIPATTSGAVLRL